MDVDMIKLDSVGVFNSHFLQIISQAYISFCCYEKKHIK